MAEHTRAADPAGGAAGDASPHRLEQQRRDNRDAMAALGAAPYGGRVDGLITLREARDRYDERADEAFQQNPDTDLRPVVKVAGRIVLKRGQGKLQWMQLRDWTTGARKQAGAETAEHEGAEGEGPEGGNGGPDPPPTL